MWAHGTSLPSLFSSLPPNHTNPLSSLQRRSRKITTLLLLGSDPKNEKIRIENGHHCGESFGTTS